MKRILDSREMIATASRGAAHSARSMLPLLLAPCVPAIVACSAVEGPLHADAALTPTIVAQRGLPPLLLQPLSTADAVALNRRIPYSSEPQIPALPFAAGKDDDARARALDCLTSAIYYEAASESDDGQRAVAQVVLNRVRHPAFPASVCGVVFQGATLPTGCQFSFTCDGSLMRMPSRRDWDHAQGIAVAALNGAVFAPVGLSTHYHTDQVVPYWAPSLAKAVQVGAHIFYRWPGTWGHPQSFTQAYAARESDLRAVRNIALLSHGLWPRQAAMPEGSKVTPRLALALDTDVELGGVLRLLTDAAAASQSVLQKQVREYFPAEAVTVIANRIRGGAKVVPAELPDASSTATGPDAAEPAPESAKPTVAAEAPRSVAQLAADFARQNKFAAFLHARRALYKAASDAAAMRAEQAANDWETYSGLPVPAGNAVLSLTQLDPDICPVFLFGASTAPVVRWPSDGAGLGPAEIFVTSGLAHKSLVGEIPARKRPAIVRAMAPDLENDIAAAVFARIASLSRGEAVGNALIKREVAMGHARLPELVERLRFFERHRSDYPTLTDFLPRMVAGMKPGKAIDAADAENGDKCAQSLAAVE